MSNEFVLSERIVHHVYSFRCFLHARSDAQDEGECFVEFNAFRISNYVDLAGRSNGEEMRRREFQQIVGTSGIGALANADFSPRLDALGRLEGTEVARRFAVMRRGFLVPCKGTR